MHSRFAAAAAAAAAAAGAGSAASAPPGRTAHSMAGGGTGRERGGKGEGEGEAPSRRGKPSKTNMQARRYNMLSEQATEGSRNGAGGRGYETSSR